MGDLKLSSTFLVIFHGETSGEKGCPNHWLLVCLGVPYHHIISWAGTSGTAKP